MKAINQNQSKLYFLLLIIILLGGWFRFYELNWDKGHLFNPDERALIMSVSQMEFPDQLEPSMYAYNGFLMYVYKISGILVAKITQNPIWAKDAASLAIIARVITGIFSTLSIYLMYLLGRRWISVGGGILSAALLAFSPGLIQLAHFSVTDNYLTFFLLLQLLICDSILKRNRTSQWVLLAIISGMTIATKTTGLIFLVIPFVTWWIVFLQRSEKWKCFQFGVLFVLLMAITTVIFTPYSFINFDKFLLTMNYERGIVKGTIRVPYTWQFEGTTPYLFQFMQLHWQLGPFIPFIGSIAMVLWTVETLYKRTFFAPLGMLVYGFLYIFDVGGWHTKFVRYTLPVVPVIILSASWALMKFAQMRLGKALIALIVATSFLWSAAFIAIYWQPQTRLAASEWIYDNVPEGSNILVEHWDEVLPSMLKGRTRPHWNTIVLELYWRDIPKKMDIVAQQLAEGDYIVMASRRLSGPISNNPQMWPLTSVYYAKLFGHELGYELIRKYVSHPQLFGITINDDDSEETFTVFDHPHVYIFENKQKLSREELTKKLKETNE